MKKKIGILLTNTGTPDAPTTRAVRRYLKEFLSDKRVVHIPSIIWQPILRALILPLRPARSAKLYKKIWEEDSPLRSIMRELQHKLKQRLGKENQFEFIVEIGMNYGNPSIPHALSQLQKQHVDLLITLPLFPQYSNTTTASSYDRVNKHLTKWSTLPERIFIRDYHDHPYYLNTLQNNISNTWQETNSNFLLISFHGMPKRFISKGDIYQKHCEATAHALAKQLNLNENQWALCYQSQFGYDKWLQPSTQALLMELPKQGIKHVDVICPGFAIDCLETLEEIKIGGQEIFHAAGGKELRYIPALNAKDEHVAILSGIICKYLNC